MTHTEFIRFLPLLTAGALMFAMMIFFPLQQKYFGNVYLFTPTEFLKWARRQARLCRLLRTNFTANAPRPKPKKRFVNTALFYLLFFSMFFSGTLAEYFRARVKHPAEWDEHLVSMRDLIDILIRNADHARKSTFEE